MRLTKSLAVGASTLALATGAAFAGEGPLTDRSDPMGYQPYAYQSYEQGGPEMLSEAQLRDALELEQTAQSQQQPSEVPISADELG